MKFHPLIAALIELSAGFAIFAGIVYGLWLVIA